MSVSNREDRAELVRTLMLRLSYAVDDMRAVDARSLDPQERMQVRAYLSQIEEGMKR